MVFMFVDNARPTFIEQIYTLIFYFL